MLATSSTILWYTTRATGIVALVLLTLTMAFGILTAGRTKSRSWPAFAQAELHKRVSVLAVVFLAFHVLTAVLDTYVDVGWTSIVVPFTSSYRPQWTGLGTVAVDLMLAVLISSALRQRIGPRTWRGIHWVAYVSWPVAIAHSLGEGTDAAKLWMDVLVALCILTVAGPLAWRIADHRRSREHQARVGASTRAVIGTVRRQPPSASSMTGALRVRGTAFPPGPTRRAPSDVPDRTRLLEKDPS